MLIIISLGYMSRSLPQLDAGELVFVRQKVNGWAQIQLNPYLWIWVPGWAV